MFATDRLRLLTPVSPRDQEDTTEGESDSEENFALITIVTYSPRTVKTMLKTLQRHDKDDMFICHKRGTKKKSELQTGIEPIASQIPAGRSNY